MKVPTVTMYSTAVCPYCIQALRFLKVKGVTDTLGYRVGDQLGAWSYGGLGANGLHLSLNAISWIAVPVTAGWCALSIWLARKQRALAEAQEHTHAEIARAA